MEQRRNYFIKKDFQAKFILKFCVLICLACLLMGGLVYRLSSRTITTSFENLRLVAKSTADFILPALMLSSIVAIILISLASIFIVLFISHRIAGPLYRFEGCLKQIAEGNLVLNTCLRKKDEVKVLAQGLNDMADRLRQAIGAVRANIERLNNELASTKERLKMGASMTQDEVDKVIGPCEDVLKGLERSISYFKIGG